MGCRHGPSRGRGDLGPVAPLRSLAGSRRRVAGDAVRLRCPSLAASLEDEPAVAPSRPRPVEVPLPPSAIFGTPNSPGLRLLTPGDPSVATPADGPVSATGPGDDTAPALPAVSCSAGPSALASPAPPATAAPTPIASANAPTRPMYLAEPTAVTPLESPCRAAMYEALCRPMVNPRPHVPLSP